MAHKAAREKDKVVRFDNKAVEAYYRRIEERGEAKSARKDSLSEVEDSAQYEDDHRED